MAENTYSFKNEFQDLYAFMKESAYEPPFQPVPVNDAYWESVVEHATQIDNKYEGDQFFHGLLLDWLNHVHQVSIESRQAGHDPTPCIDLSRKEGGSDLNRITADYYNLVQKWGDSELDGNWKQFSSEISAFDTHGYQFAEEWKTRFMKKRANEFMTEYGISLS